MSEKLQDVLDEIGECASIAEIEALVADLRDGENDSIAERAEVQDAFGLRLRELQEKEETEETEETEEEESVEVPADAAPPDPVELCVRLLAEIEELKRARSAVARAGRSYKLLKFDVSWSTKPQVRVIGEILAANFEVGQVVGEEEIVRAVVANEGLLRTRQGGKRIWDYYKGYHVDGLTMHGNVEKL